MAAYAESDQARVGAFNEALKALGWANEHNVRIDYRWPDTDIDRTRIFASELVALRPDVLLATNTTSARALRSATQTIPTVFVTLSDPVGTGIISNLANPEANITGFPNYEYSLVGKWMTLLRTVNPRVSHVALLYNPMAAAFAPNYFRAAEDAGRSTGIKLISASVQSELEIEHFIAQLASDSAGGLIALPDIFMNSRRALIVSLAARYRVPAIYYSRVFAVDGGLLSYGPDVYDQFRRSASYVDRILRGAKPADLPVQAPVKFELIVNLKTAKGLGLTIPDAFLLTADEVIE